MNQIQPVLSKSTETKVDKLGHKIILVEGDKGQHVKTRSPEHAWKNETLIYLLSCL